MQKVKLPISVDSVRAANNRLEILASLDKSLLSRLIESTISINTDIDTYFAFDVDQQKLKIFNGKANSLVNGAMSL